MPFGYMGDFGTDVKLENFGTLTHWATSVPNTNIVHTEMSPFPPDPTAKVSLEDIVLC